MRTVREHRFAGPAPLAGATTAGLAGQAKRCAGSGAKGERPCCPVPRFAEFPAILPLPACRTGAVASVPVVKRNGAELFSALSLFSCKAAVVCAGLTANGGKGGARPRRGGA